MIRKSVAEILTQHVTYELEAIDRLYLNAYVPSLQTGAGFAYFLKTQLGGRVPSTVMIAPMSQRFVEAMEHVAEREGVDLVKFEKGQRKDDVAQKYLTAFDGDDRRQDRRGVSQVGSAGCRTPSPPRTARPGIGTSSRSSRPNSPSRRCWTGRRRGAASSKKSSGRISTSAGPIRCS
jgi:hypothetical protein